MSKKNAAPISGFPEWLPEERAVELEWIDGIRSVYEAYGYTSLETRSVEPLPVLLKQGDTDKEIYGIHRVAADLTAADEAGLALHYDLTVPFARYTAQNLNALTFPFKRFQIQKVWRGERPQSGRFREFTQCDIDVVDRDNVSLYYDYEVTAAALDALSKLSLGPLKLRLNNRKLLEGFYRGLGITDVGCALRIVDKIEKVGVKGISDMLRSEMSLSDKAISACLEIGKISGSDMGTILKRIKDIGISHPLMEEGKHELAMLRQNLKEVPPNTSVEVDLSITRGLAYYTGNVFETLLEQSNVKASICSGGRYENLTGDIASVKLPGVGISIGLTRVMSLMKAAELLPHRRPTPAEIMVAYTPSITQEMQIVASQMLRRNGFKVDVYPEPVRLDRQLRYANRKKIPFVYFVGVNGQEGEVKNMATGIQGPFDQIEVKRAINLG